MQHVAYWMAGRVAASGIKCCTAAAGSTHDLQGQGHAALVVPQRWLLECTVVSVCHVWQHRDCGLTATALAGSLVLEQGAGVVPWFVRPV